MLVLTRKQGEKIRIGDDVVITVVRTKGKAVRLGIQAPSHVPVLRGEIALAIEAERAVEHGAAEDEPGGVEPQGEIARVSELSHAQCASAASSVSSRPLQALVAAR
jgi:carbon storage regulator